MALTLAEGTRSVKYKTSGLYFLTQFSTDHVFMQASLNILISLKIQKKCAVKIDKLCCAGCI